MSCDCCTVLVGELPVWGMCLTYGPPSLISSSMWYRRKTDTPTFVWSVVAYDRLLPPLNHAKQQQFKARADARSLSHPLLLLFLLSVFTSTFTSLSLCFSHSSSSSLSCVHSLSSYCCSLSQQLYGRPSVVVVDSLTALYILQIPFYKFMITRRHRMIRKWGAMEVLACHTEGSGF